MAAHQSLKSHKDPKTTKTAKAPRPSLIALAFATKALRKVTPSSRSLLLLLSSATLMHPEIPLAVPYGSSSSPLARVVIDGQHSLDEHSVVAKNCATSPLHFKPPADDAEECHDAEAPSQLTISSQRHLTFPPAAKTGYRSQSSLDLPRSSTPWSTETGCGIGQGTIINDSTRSGFDNLFRTFSDEPIHIHRSQMIHRHDIAPMIELHMLAWREDRFVRRLQRNQIPRAEIQTMRTMLGDRTTSALDNVLVARINSSHDPMDIVGWLSCSIIRFKPRNRQAAIDSRLRALEWNLATAAKMNKVYNAGSATYLFGNSKSLKERNDLIEVLCRGTRWSQKTEFQDQVRNFAFCIIPVVREHQQVIYLRHSIRSIFNGFICSSISILRLLLNFSRISLTWRLRPIRTSSPLRTLWYIQTVPQAEPSARS